MTQNLVSNSLSPDDQKLGAIGPLKITVGCESSSASRSGVTQSARVNSLERPGTNEADGPGQSEHTWDLSDRLTSSFCPLCLVSSSHRELVMILDFLGQAGQP